MIELPPHEITTFRNESDYYGAAYVASRYCGTGFKNEPLFPLWQHGWIPDAWQIHPYIVLASVNAHRKCEHFLVTRKSEEVYLKKCGYRNVQAIGKPLVYLKESSVPRMPRSLLVMPAHTDGHAVWKWNFEDYSRQIHAIRNRFDRVTVCVSPGCAKNGYWTVSFKKLGFDIIEGADIFDQNALFRLQALFSSYEYVTTNRFGSLIPYASYFGAKVSIFGEYVTARRGDFLKTPFGIRYPELANNYAELYSESYVRKLLPQFFLEPWDAVSRREWACKELGADCRIAPEMMKRLFRWRFKDRVKFVLKRMLMVSANGSSRDALMRYNRFFHVGRVAYSKLLGSFRRSRGKP